jgi:hypothetical protein
MTEPGKNWQAQFDNEIQKAVAARDAGNDGMSRVCARRAVGLIIGEYLDRLGVNVTGMAAYDLIRYLSEKNAIDPAIREVASHYLLRVTPEGNLPVPIDLIAEAFLLKDMLLG